MSDARSALWRSLRIAAAVAALALAACGQLHAPRVIDYGTSYDQGGGT